MEHEQQKLRLEEQQRQQQLEQEKLEHEQQKLRLEEQQRQQQLEQERLEHAQVQEQPDLDRQKQSTLEQSDNQGNQSSSVDVSVPLAQLPTAAVDGTVFATLRCRDDQQPWEYQMRKTRIVLGRKLKGEQVCDCEVGVGKFISREHAVIVCDTTRTPYTLTLQCVCTGKAWVTPLGRRSDVVELTQHDAPHELQDDDEICIGRAAGEVRLIIEIPADGDAADAAARKSPIPEVEELIFEQTGPLGIVFGESKFPENRLDAASPLMTVVDQVKEESLAGRLYAQLLEPLAADYERIVSHVNGIDVTAVGFDETLSLIKGPRPLVVRTEIRKRLPLDNSTAEYAEPLADGSILPLNTPLPPVTEETLSDLGAASPSQSQHASMPSVETAVSTQLTTPDRIPENAAAHPTPEMVREMAHYLGIDDQEEVHLLPIAHNALVEELPKGWEERLSPTDGAPYYVELATGKVSDEHPADGHFRKVLEHVRTTSPADASSSHHGEMKFFDADAQQHYTYNFKTGQTYHGSITDQGQALPGSSDAKPVPIAIPAFARLPDAAVGHTPAVASTGESMLGLTPTKLLESQQSSIGGAKTLFPSSPGETNADLTVARESVADIPHNLDQLNRSGSTVGETETAGTEIVQIQAHNRALSENNQLQREARKEASSASWSVAREGAKHRLKHIGINVIKFAARNNKPATKILMLSQDMKYLQWGDSVDKLSSRLEVKGIERLEYGDIQVSQRAASKHPLVATAFSEPWQTFFLWDGKRSYDFYVPDSSGGTGATIQTVMGINAARGQKGRSTRAGHFLWRSVRLRIRVMAWDAHGTESIAARRKVLTRALQSVSQLSTVQRSALDGAAQRTKS
jgi:hypothetical protein